MENVGIDCLWGRGTRACLSFQYKQALTQYETPRSYLVNQHSSSNISVMLIHFRGGPEPMYLFPSTIPQD